MGDLLVFINATKDKLKEDFKDDNEYIKGYVDALEMVGEHIERMKDEK